jgi:hypothetical protein
MKPLYLFCLLISLLFASCNKNKKLKDLTAQLNQKEQQLLLLQQELHSKEDSLAQLKKLLDSTQIHLDSVGTFNPELVGDWQVKMVCTETTCDGSAIGDTKTEQWNISFENNKVIAKASTNDKLNRIYSGLYKNKSLQLIAHPSTSNTVMKVTLQQTKKNTLEGTREILMGDQCKIIYSMHLVKQ